MPNTFPALQKIIEDAWLARETLAPHNAPAALIQAIQKLFADLEQGTLSVVTRHPSEGWQVHAWIKQAILLSFRLFDNTLYPAAEAAETATPWTHWYDKIPQKFATWNARDFQAASLRVLPGALVRASAYLAPNVVLMPCFVNVGAHVGEGTMIDTWATVGSCAHIGARCHISGGVGIGGVLEPLQATPVIIEDDCFIGARSEIAEGVIVEQGSVIAMGVFLGASTKIIDRQTGEIFRGRVPAYSVVVPGTLPGQRPTDPSLACAVIVKRVDAQTRAKTSLNELLRDATHA